MFHKSKNFTGNFLIDDTFLAGESVSDFDQYRVDPKHDDSSPIRTLIAKAVFAEPPHGWPGQGHRMPSLGKSLLT
jgi:hypothetical protein